jgi:hypothetical protein
VDLEHELELLVSGLVEHAIEGESGVVDDDVDLSESPKVIFVDRSNWRWVG